MASAAENVSIWWRHHVWHSSNIGRIPSQQDEQIIWGVVIFRAIEFGRVMVQFYYICQSCSSTSGWYIIVACVSVSVLAFSEVLDWFRQLQWCVDFFGGGWVLSYMAFLSRKRHKTPNNQSLNKKTRERLNNTEKSLMGFIFMLRAYPNPIRRPKKFPVWCMDCVSLGHPLLSDWGEGISVKRISLGELPRTTNCVICYRTEFVLRNIMHTIHTLLYFVVWYRSILTIPFRVASLALGQS